MTIDNWLELELVRGINDQNLQKRLLRERNPMLQDMISIATQWQSAETAMAQFIIDNEPSETDSKPEEANDTTYGRTYTTKQIKKKLHKWIAKNEVKPTVLGLDRNFDLTLRFSENSSEKKILDFKLWMSIKIENGKG